MEEEIKCYGIEAVKEGNKWRTSLFIRPFKTRDLGELDKIEIENGNIKNIRILDDRISIIGKFSCKIKEEENWEELSCKYYKT